MDKNVILAKKYGRAIYEIAAEQHCLEQTEEDLRLIADTIGKSKELGEILNHPLLAKDVKKDTIKKLFADKVQPIVYSSAMLLSTKAASLILLPWRMSMPILRIMGWAWRKPW